MLMFEKVNPYHPDKVADRIAGAIVDLCYAKNHDPKVAVEVLIGHGVCHIIAETSESISIGEAESIVRRIAGDVETDFVCVQQDKILAGNQAKEFRCGDNGIFKGVPVTAEQEKLASIAYGITETYPSDGKYVIDGDKLIICQSNADEDRLSGDFPNAVINPLGHWTGGTDVDTGATNRKLGSDMGDSVTGGGLHGKDLSKADVSVNIYAWAKAQREHRVIELSCAIGDATVDGRPYSEIVEEARSFIQKRGGFEKFAEWGLICQ
jgi:S-adenosylmethionine synthetase